MEILQFLMSLLKNSSALEKFAPLFNLLEQNNFDIRRTLSCVKPEMLRPIIEELSVLYKNKSPTDFVGQENALSPILNIADKEIVFCLNRVL